MIIRFAKRKAAWEETSAEVIRDIEFRRKDGEYDLRPSVYCIDGRESVRCFAEHAAAAPIEMPASALGLDFTDTKLSLANTPGSSKFKFIEQCHREIIAESATDLCGLIASVLSDSANKKHVIEKRQVVCSSRSA